MTRGGGVGATTNRQTRDEGSKEEGKDGKATAMQRQRRQWMERRQRQWTAMTAMDGAMAMQQQQKVQWQRDGNDGDSDGRRNGDGRRDGNSNGNGGDGRRRPWKARWRWTT
jgi:hypothetical protein